MSVSPKVRSCGRPGSTNPATRTPNSPKRKRGDGFCRKTVPALTLGAIWTCCLWGQAAPEPIKLGSVVVSGSIRSRVESWEWFTPNTGAAGAQGQLGLGASYFVSNDRKSNVGMLFPKQVLVRVKSLFGSEASSV